MMVIVYSLDKKMLLMSARSHIYNFVNVSETMHDTKWAFKLEGISSSSSSSMVIVVMEA